MNQPEAPPGAPDLHPLLHARSVAIVGISHPDRFGGQVYTNLRDFGYPGAIYGVNPRYDSLFSERCYPALSDLPEVPDCAVLAVPNSRLFEAFQEAASLGVRAAVIFGSAYLDEPVNGTSLQQAIADLASRDGIAICGPNCMGFLSIERRLTLSGYPVVPGTPPGHITLISHSGSVFDSFWQNNRRISFNYVVSSGNEITTTMADYMHFALEDPATRLLALFLEAVRDPPGFRRALEAAAARDVPVIALKVGRSREAARFVQSHSGALAGRDTVYDALFDYYGVSRVRSLDEMMDALELFSAGMRVSTPAASAILDSGGERAMLVDLAEEIGVPFARLSPGTVQTLSDILEPGLEPVNPLDAWGTGNEIERIYRDCLLALDADPATGLTLFTVDLMRHSNLPPTYVDVVLPVLPRLKNPLAFLVNVSAAASEEQIDILRQAGVPVLMGTETGLRAVAHLFAYREYRNRRDQEASILASVPAGIPGSPEERAAVRRLIQESSEPLDEHASFRVLRAYGIPTPPQALASTVGEALAAAEEIGYPVALKSANGASHKSDVRGVRLGIRDPRSLESAYAEMAPRLGPRTLVQQMAGPGAELLIGLYHDLQFGPLLAIGTGGIFVEIFQDTRLLLLPTGEQTIRRAVLGLQGAPLLLGARGRAPADLDGIVDACLRLGWLAEDLGDLIAELDINPLIVTEDGVVAVDALVVPAGKEY